MPTADDNLCLLPTITYCIKYNKKTFLTKTQLELLSARRTAIRDHPWKISFRDDNKGDDVALCYPLILANVQRTMTAPTTAVTISPSQPKALMPKRPKSHPPTVPPMSPRKRLTRQPLPSPFCILQYCLLLFRLS